MSHPEKDEDEIDLDDVEEEEDNDNENPAAAVSASTSTEEVNKESVVKDSKESQDSVVHAPSSEPQAAPEPEEAQPLSKAAAMKQRLRLLKQKMNQARNLNQQAVKQEGERMGSHEAQLKEKRRLKAVDKQSTAANMANKNQKALQLAQEHDVDSKYLTQQASESVQYAQKRLESQERNQYSVNDTYNPEGQHRAYQNSLKQLPRSGNQHQQQQSASAAPGLHETYDPLHHQVVETAAGAGAAGGAAYQRERQGARHLAQEMHRRMEKSRAKEADKKRKQEDKEAAGGEGDVSYINARNKRFNQKINRTYDKDTAEIKQNLERGTAL